jgi:hypothetical protein
MPDSRYSLEVEEDDIRALLPTTGTRVAGALLLLAGFFTALLGVQTLLILRLQGLAVGIIVVELVLGPATFGFGWGVARVRGWAAVGGAVSAALMALLGAVYVVLALLSGVVSLLAMGVVPLAAVAAVLAAFAVGPGRRADAARERLRDQGLETGA